MTHPSAAPGGYGLRENASTPRLSGAKSHIFRPPRTPSSASSSMILSKSTTSIISATTSIATQGLQSGTRKRTLNDYHERQSRTVDEWERDGSGESRWTGAGSEDYIPASPKPFGITRYDSTGGIYAPSLATGNFHGNASDVGYRTSLREGVDPKTPGETPALFEQEGSSYFALDRAYNGRRMVYPADQRGNAWKKGAISIVGAVVGKAWDFCKAGATVFTGFRAGGGHGYNVDSAAHFEAAENENNWKSEKQDWEHGEREGTPVPGQFPDEDFIPNYMDDPTSDGSPVRPSKRRQVSGEFRDDEAKSWVVVNQPTPAASPLRPQPQARYSITSARPGSRRLMVPNARPASRVGLVAPNRPSILPRGSHAGSPALQANRGASYASPRTPASVGRASKIPRASPMRDVKPRTTEDSASSKEAKKWKAMKRKEEREADESIRRLDAQLKAMIREGKEALGTKVEVELEDDYGFEDNSKRWAY